MTNNGKNKYSSFDELPAILSANDLAIFLGVSRATAYNAMRGAGFPTIRIGEKRMLVEKESLIKWLDQQATKQS